MYFHQTPWLLKRWHPHFLWSQPTREPLIHLTFDDGPIPEVTEWVLKTLSAWQAKATFFCVGDNVRKYPALFGEVIAHGHRVGNHTFHHLNGWRTNLADYLANVERCRQAMGLPPGKPLLFRPPYGRITRSQACWLRQSYRIVMWDVLTGDFDPNLSPDQCLRNALRYTQGGSIVVFHDSLKARQNLQYALPRYLEHFSRAGYYFEAI